MLFTIFQILLQLVIEAPFHIMQPNNKEVEFLINSLSHYESNCFLHKLCRLFLSRFSWDAFKDLVSFLRFMKYHTGPPGF